MKKNLKLIGWVIAGNALDYYDFMLFAHLGMIVTKAFFPELDPTHAHLLSLLLFAIPFVVRPVGGYLFGWISDRSGRGYALSETLKYASFATLGIALLPGYEIGGILSIAVFVLLRALQGLSFGGEYLTAGTLLLERFTTRRSFLSAVLGISGTVGSLAAFAFSWLYFHEYLSGEQWRFAFGLGAVATYVSYLCRKQLKKDMLYLPEAETFCYHVPRSMALTVTLFSGMLIGVVFWIPMVYVNFYLTKILHYPATVGLNATFIALVGSIIVTPLIGYITDRFSRPEIMMTLGAILSIPFSMVGFLMVEQGMLSGQLFLVLAIVIFGAPQHAVMNALFPREIRGRSVSTAYTVGASVGSMIPVLSGYLAEHFAMYHAPIYFVAAFGAATAIVFYRFIRVLSTSP